MTSLTERAEQAATGTEPEAPYTPPTLAAEPLPDIDIEGPGPEGPEQVSAVVAWSRVMDDIRGISKREQYNAAGTRYNFRGVDRTVNAFAPVLRRHGVLVIPSDVQASYRDFTNSNKKIQRECTVIVTWTIYGPKGDHFTAQSAGEALDSADKGTAKAQSVALRVLLLTAGMVPTGDPDPDSVYIDRGEARIRSAEEYRDEILDPKTSPQRLSIIRDELDSLRMLNSRVQNETGELETLDSIGGRMYMERTGGGS
ncbi:ERF family protein [Streptomyces alboflavus]|uniref:ERF family protein n=1 Tax=Streptomyces alboflavus TaxID=67267 RepID=UPI000AB78B1A|nr:ERF family protein [Streptomyces alboflavus]